MVDHIRLAYDAANAHAKALEAENAKVRDRLAAIRDKKAAAWDTCVAAARKVRAAGDRIDRREAALTLAQQILDTAELIEGG